MADKNDEFYTGYLPEAPPGIARRTRLAVIASVALAAAVAVLLTSGQKGFGDAVFEFGIVKDFEGVIRETPHPMLEIERPGDTTGGSAVSRFYLVNPFKFAAAVAGLDGQRVRLKGSLIYRDHQTMLEIVPDSIEKIGAGPAADEGQNIGERTLQGRIVDSKCYFGVMKPGEGTVHRACAVRCISGGIPPVLVVDDPAGAPLDYYLLVGPDGQTINQEVLPFVAEPIEVTGEVVMMGDVRVLRAAPATFKRLAG